MVAADPYTAGLPIDPIALNLLKLYPRPTPATAPLSNNFVFTPKQTNFAYTYNARLDHQFNPNNALFARFTANHVDAVIPDRAAERRHRRRFHQPRQRPVRLRRPGHRHRLQRPAQLHPHLHPQPAAGAQGGLHPHRQPVQLTQLRHQRGNRGRLPRQRRLRPRQLRPAAGQHRQLRAAGRQQLCPDPRHHQHLPVFRHRKLHAWPARAALRRGVHPPPGQEPAKLKLGRQRQLRSGAGHRRLRERSHNPHHGAGAQQLAGDLSCRRLRRRRPQHRPVRPQLPHLGARLLCPGYLARHPQPHPRLRRAL